MKVKNIDLLQINDALTYISEENTGAWYQVGKNMRIIKPHIAEFRESHQEIINKYAQRDKDNVVKFLDETKTQIDFGKHSEETTDLWNSLLQEEIDVDFHKFEYKTIGNQVLDAIRVEPLLDRIIIENGSK